jgi:hypothetical protein
MSENSHTNKSYIILNYEFRSKVYDAKK